MLYNANHSAPAEAPGMDDLILEIKVLTRFVKHGLNVPDDPQEVREDVQSEAELVVG